MKKYEEKKLTEAIRKYLSGKADEEEKKYVEEWYGDFDFSIFDMEENRLNISYLQSWRKIEKVIGSEGRTRMKVVKVMTVRKFYKWIAAAIILLLGTGLYFGINSNWKGGDKDKMVQSSELEEADFMPGGNKAVLTLGNGKQIILDSTNNGLLAMQGRTKVIKLDEGQLDYAQNEQKSGRNSQEPIYNTISTPRGGKYELTLPDGSKVWLNAESSLRFPTVFVGKERYVEIKGEAYFDIAENPSRPFRLNASGMEVTVLGTEFNVNSFKSGETKATLVSGKVKVVGEKNKTSLVLKPGEQARLTRKGATELTDYVNVDKEIAWKNDLFWFENSGIEEVAEALSRWYNIDINIQGVINDKFTGSIPMAIPFSKVFEILQKTGSIHYHINGGRQVVVTS